jgi:L-ascorbate metabolism protein UlaG (beta-lactamase superfamily)
MNRLLHCAAAVCWLALAPAMAQTSTPAATALTGKVEVVWLGQAAFKITSPAGKVIVTDPWLRTNPLTPPEYKKLENFGKIDVLLLTHGHFDHMADAPALALMYDVPLRAPGDLAQSA